MKEKNSKLQARIGYLTKEVADRDKLMQKFILNNESEASVKEKCVLQSYKSKLASIERKLEFSKKQNLVLKYENTKLKEQEQLLNSNLQQLSAEKDMLHNECVKMSQRIYIQAHERRQQMVQVDEELPNEAAHQRSSLVVTNTTMNATATRASVRAAENSNIINIETGALDDRQQRKRAKTPHNRRAIEVEEIERPLEPPRVQFLEPTTTNSGPHPTRTRQNETRAVETETTSTSKHINKVPELVQTIDKFQHIVGCEICTIDGTMCDFARQKFPKKDPVELVQLDENTQTPS